MGGIPDVDYLDIVMTSKKTSRCATPRLAFLSRNTKLAALSKGREFVVTQSTTAAEPQTISAGLGVSLHAAVLFLTMIV